MLWGLFFPALVPRLGWDPSLLQGDPCSRAIPRGATCPVYVYAPLTSVRRWLIPSVLGLRSASLQGSQCVLQYNCNVGAVVGRGRPGLSELCHLPRSP